jgi:hypothetical protein
MNIMTPNLINTISEEPNPLATLVDFERSVEKVDVEQPVNVRLLTNKKVIRLDYKGRQIFGKVERPLIHQLGARLWPEEGDYFAIRAKWEKLAAESQSILEQNVADLFCHHDLQLRVFSGNEGQKSLYGVVSPHFIDVNQVEFRNAYLEQSAQITQMKARSLGLETDGYGNIVEWFGFDSHGFQTEYRYGLVYAKNNGYDAYKVNWERYVLVCSNGLRDWRGSKFRWKHTSEIELHDFITNTIAEGKANQSHLEKCIARAQNITLDPILYVKMMDRLSLAHASKQRIDERLKVECQDVGQNEWALSQALTWLGTHEKALPYRVKSNLVDFGTDVLEKSLETAACEKPKLTPNGFFGLIVFKDQSTSSNRGWSAPQFLS